MTVVNMYLRIESDGARAKRGTIGTPFSEKEHTIHTYKREMHVYKQKVQSSRWKVVNFEFFFVNKMFLQPLICKIGF